MKHAKCYIKDYPRPQFTRQKWLNLNGEWSFIYEKDLITNELISGFNTEKKILVPFTLETKMSGINVQTQREEVWYSRKVNLTTNDLTNVVMLNFEGVDYFTTVFVNGKFVGENKGGYHRFSFDIRKALKVGENVIVVKVNDSLDYNIPRGKQRWRKESFECFYTQTTGIWKTVWLEFLDDFYLDNVKITPIFEDDSVEFDVNPNKYCENLTCEVVISFNGTVIRKASVSLNEKNATVKMLLTSQEFGAVYWFPHCPNFYDVEYSLFLDGKLVDKVGSYFGLRDIRTCGNKILCNNKPIYLKLVLDQGYFKDSGLTAPNEEELYKDIIIAKEMGFNGARKHEKIEDERFLYYADVLGYIVWCEMPSCYNFNDQMTENVLSEWHKIVRQNYNHPSIFCWVTLNESWGVKTIYSNVNMQSLANAMYYQTKTIDSMRPVVTNDGWEHTISDILTLHHYEQDPQKFYEFYDSLEKLTQGHFSNVQRQPYAKGYAYKGQPIIMSEYGGTAYVKDNENGNWGYGVGCKDESELAKRFEGLYDAIKRMDGVCGLCYTQLTDVFQEVNGLFDMDRNPKINPQAIKTIFEK